MACNYIKPILFCLFAAPLMVAGQDYSFPVADWEFYDRPVSGDSLFSREIHAPRGSVYDRKGRLLVGDSILYDLVVIPAKVKAGDTAAICGALRISYKEFRDRVRFASGSYDPRQPAGAFAANRPAVFKGLLDRPAAARLFGLRNSVRPGFRLEKRSLRNYPDSTAPHLLGYIIAADSGFLRRHPGVGYSPGDKVGAGGLENMYDSVLRGRPGKRYLLVGDGTKVARPYNAGAVDQPPVRGEDLYTSLDMRLQILGERLMKGKRGAIVAVDPATGGVLAMVSAPGYSARQMALSRNQYFPSLRKDPASPMLDRAVSSVYPPGSVFKVFQALAGLADSVTSPDYRYTCNGRYLSCGPSGKPACHAAAPHTVNLRQAIAISCNSYFADLYSKVIGGKPDSGLTKWGWYMQALGFGTPLGIDLGNEKAGTIPSVKTYDARFGKGWGSCNTVSNSIGQGDVAATVLQLANGMAILANGGWYYTPHIVERIAGEGKPGTSLQFPKRETAIPLEWIDAVRQGMYDVVQSDGGTARKARISGLEMCGKTGTAEAGGGAADHSVFAAFAPADTPRIAIVCMVENGGFGSDMAAPVASLMVEDFLKGKIEGSRKSWVDSFSRITIPPAPAFKVGRAKAALPNTGKVKSSASNPKAKVENVRPPGKKEKGSEPARKAGNDGEPAATKGRNPKKQ